MSHLAGLRSVLSALCYTGIKELVEKLHAMGKSVYIVSGGFRQIIEPIAEVLKIPKSNIHANRILYDVCEMYAM